MSELPPGTVSREEAASQLGLDLAGVERLVAAGALETAAEGRAITQISLLTHLSRRITLTVKKALDPPSAPGGMWGGLALRLLLLLAFLGSMVDVFSLQANKPVVPPLVLLVGLVPVVGVAVWLARRQPELGNTNGFGTSLYGSRRTSDGLVGTAYVVVAIVPIAPLASYVVLEEGPEKVESGGMIRTRGYFLRALPAICWPQAAPTVALGWSALLLGGYLLELRTTRTRPIAEAFRAWLEATEAELLTPTDPLRRVIRYYKRHFDALTRFNRTRPCRSTTTSRSGASRCTRSSASTPSSPGAPKGHIVGRRCSGWSPPPSASASMCWRTSPG